MNYAQIQCHSWNANGQVPKRSRWYGLQVNVGLRVLTRPNADKLPEIYRTLGTDYAERVLPSIIQVGGAAGRGKGRKRRACGKDGRGEAERRSGAFQTLYRVMRVA